jgi:AcrR family transcriptional regulator
MKKRSTRPADLLDISEDREISIGQLAESVTRNTGFRCTPGMINNYEKLGLIQHSSRSEGGVRRFRISDIQKVSCIKRWQSEGMSLSQIDKKMEECMDEFPSAEILPYVPEDRRAQILEASARVFPQKGYETTTMQEVAAEANISPSMIYQFYRSKEELFLAFTENTSYTHILELITESLDKQESFDYEDVRQALFDVALNFAAWHVRRIELIRLLIATSRNFPDIGKHYLHNLIRPTEHLLAQFFGHLAAHGRFSVEDPELAARVFFGIFADMAMARNWFRGNDEPVVPDKADILTSIDIYLNGALRKEHTG